MKEEEGRRRVKMLSKSGILYFPPTCNFFTFKSEDVFFVLYSTT